MALTRLSPGVYRDAQGRTVRSTNGKSSSGGKTSTGTKKPTGLLAPLPKNFSDITKGPAEAIGGQYALNKDIMQQNIDANRINQSGPTGSVNYVKNPDGSYTQSTTLSPEQQQLYNQQQGLNLNIGGNIDAALTQGRQNLAQGFLGGTNLNDERQRVEGGLINRYNQINDPIFQRERAQAEQRLYEQGHASGSPEYQRQMDMLSRQQNDARQGYQSQALTQGLNEYQTRFNTELQKYNLPMQQAQGYAGMYGGYQGPQAYQPTAVEFGQVDVPGTVSAFDQNSIARLAASKVGGGGGRGGGGGGGGPDYGSLLWNAFSSGGDLQQPYQKPQTNVWGGMGQAFGNGIAMGAAKW